MADSKISGQWHGISRETIDWHPTVDAKRCIGCGTCVTGCGRKVWRFDFGANKAVVRDPLKCLVGCTTCANTCPSGAIHFPDIKAVKAIERGPARRFITAELLEHRAEFDAASPTQA